MPDCCEPSGYDQLFSAKNAERALQSYDRKGLNKMAKRMVEYLRSQGVEGHRVLEVGGGIGALGVELLKAGAASAVNVELSGGYQEAAAELLRREGLEGRVEQRMGDFTEMAEGMKADDVVMNRVICCYPHMEKLMDAALSVSSRYLAVTFPRDRILSRIVGSLENTYRRIRGVQFRSYLHSPRAILETAGRAGFAVVFSDRDLIWHGVVFERAV